MRRHGVESVESPVEYRLPDLLDGLHERGGGIGDRRLGLEEPGGQALLDLAGVDVDELAPWIAERLERAEAARQLAATVGEEEGGGCGRAGERELEEHLLCQFSLKL